MRQVFSFYTPNVISKGDAPDPNHYFPWENQTCDSLGSFSDQLEQQGTKRRSFEDESEKEVSLISG
jgi:hypothetical protein